MIKDRRRLIVFHKKFMLISQRVVRRVQKKLLSFIRSGAASHLVIRELDRVCVEKGR